MLTFRRCPIIAINKEIGLISKSEMNFLNEFQHFVSSYPVQNVRTGLKLPSAPLFPGLVGWGQLGGKWRK